MNKEEQKGNTIHWHSVVTKYNKPSQSRSIWQIINSVGPYLVLWILIVQLIDLSFLLTIPFIVLAAGFLVRIFIIFHDCGHGSFFKSRRTNVIVGKICGILAFTPYYKWTESHQVHHQTVGNLDKRGDGDVWTLTVDEYQSRKKWQKFLYRLFRHPVFLMLIGGPLSFILFSRFTRKSFTKKQKLNVYFTNVVLLTLAVLVSLLIGWQTFLLIQLPIIWLASMAGIYLFYLQHQYDEVIWTRNKDWDYKELAIHGSSFFKLPAILRWFTGNIGFHHVHHLGPTIPNYYLPKCHNENDLFQEVKAITFFESFKSLKLRLWDEKNQRIVSFKELKLSS